MKRLLTLGVLTALACAREPELQSETAAAEATPEPYPAASDRPVLASGAASRWSLRPVPATPPYFQAAGWAGEREVWGIARNRPTLVMTDSAGVRTVRGTAWASFQAPDGGLAWTNEQGLWLGLSDSAVTQLIDATDAHPASEGGPPAEVLFEPSTGRLLVGWGLEWDAVYSLSAGEPGSVRPLDTSLPGYFLKTAELWLDSARVLFTARANQSRAGAQEYGNGYRADLAVLDLGDESFRTVTSVADGVFLDAAGLVDGRVVVSEIDSAYVPVRHWSYDPATWEREPFAAPAAWLLPAPAGGRVLALERLAESADTTTYGLSLIERGRRTTLGTVAGQQVEAFWAPDGRRLMLRVDWQAWIVEPR